ncbi:Hypothetical protein SMAX5B_010682, partial [Scophthalmus maximus]
KSTKTGEEKNKLSVSREKAIAPSVVSNKDVLHAEPISRIQCFSDFDNALLPPYGGRKAGGRGDGGDGRYADTSGVRRRGNAEMLWMVRQPFCQSVRWFEGA